MAKVKKVFLSDGNCQRDGTPYEKRAGLWVCPKCGNMRSLEYENNPYYGQLVRHAPAEGIDGGSRRMPVRSDYD